MAAKLSISIIDPALVAWAQQRAERQETSVSAVVSDALRLARRNDALDRYLEWAGPVGELTPLLVSELTAEIEGVAPVKKATSPKKRRK